MKSWENLLGIWHFRALPPINSWERCQLWQCLNLSRGHVLFKQGRKECTSIGPVTPPRVPAAGTGAAAAPGHVDLWKSSPQQPGLHQVLKVLSENGVKESISGAIGFVPDCAVVFKMNRKVMRFTHEHWKWCETAQNEQKFPNGHDHVTCRSGL